MNTTYETEFNVFCVILRSAARFSFTRTLPLLPGAIRSFTPFRLSPCFATAPRTRREETLRKNTTYEILIHISLNSTKIHMSGIELLIVQSVFDEFFWRFRSQWFVFTASVKVPYFGDWIINFMNDSNRNLFIIFSNQHFWSFLSGCLSNDWWHVFFFEIGRDVEGIEVLEVLFRRTCGAVRSWAKAQSERLGPYGAPIRAKR